MYKLFVKNLEGFAKIFSDDIRLKMAAPLYLLKDINCFNSHKANRTEEYCNLFEIIRKAQGYKENVKYRSFGMFLNELYLQYFDFSDPGHCSSINKESLDYQLDLLYQFMFPAYNI